MTVSEIYQQSIKPLAISDRLQLAEMILNDVPTESPAPYDDFTNASVQGDNWTEESWTEEKNARRCDLIDREIEGTISEVERIELENLQQQAVAYRDRVAPLPIEGARKLHQELLAKKRQQDRES